MPPRYHVFLSHSSADKPAVEKIARKLREAGIEPFLDKWHLIPGDPWQEALEKALDQSSTCAVFLGPGELGPWHNEEMRAVLDQRTRNNSFRVVPVLLPGAQQPGAKDLPRFLARLTWVDFRQGLDDADSLHRLISGIKGNPPGPGDGADPDAALNALPIDDVPAPGPLPAGSRMPLSHNPLFVGREEDLKTLARQLKAGETSAVSQVETAAATGLGGIGKTQLASEFVHRYGQFFAGGVFWMSFADAAAVPIEVADCGRGLNLLAGFDALALEQQVRLVEEAWRSPLPQLLIFDNCEEEKLLRRWRPRFGNARVLVTSRRAEWDPTLSVKKIPLTTLPRPASIELLRLFRPDVPETEPALDAIARELGDLPLALHLAGSFLRKYRASPHGQPAAYLEALRHKDLLDHPSLQGLGSGLSPTGHEGHVGRTFALSFERLDSSNFTDALAIDLLTRASWFASGEPIPRSLLFKTISANTGDLTTDLRPEDALHRLTDLGLVESNERHDLLMHRLVSAWANGVPGSDEAQRAVEETVLEEAKRLNETRNPALLMAWQPHLRAITDRAMEREDRMAAQICDELGLHLWLAGDYFGGRPYLERAIAIHEAVSGPEHEDLAHSLNVIGVLLIYLNDFPAARPYLERALAIREKVLGPDHPDIAESLNDLGLLLDNQNDYEGALPYHKRALAIREKALGQEHPDTARSLINLGGVLRSQRDFGESRIYLERALAIEEKAVGPEHPDTAIALLNLGALLEDQKDFEGARTYFERALAIQEKVLGPEHPNTAWSLMSLGTLYFDQNNVAKARGYLKRALDLLQARLGPSHPDTQEARRQFGKLPGARRLKEPRPKKKS
jgi:tetratricopeptide (TPR) repeat protein